MKNLKLLLFTLMAVLFVPTMVNAEEVDTKEKLNSCIASDSMCVLTSDISADVVVPKDAEVTIDLNGHNLSNETNKDTIYVTLGAKLTIQGEGTVTNTKKGYAPLFNNGTVIIDGGTFNRDTTGGNDWYVILNHGDMTINNAKVSVNGTGSSLVDNGYSNYGSGEERTGYVSGINIESPSLTINGGIFDGGMNTIKNDDNSILVINDGTFTNSYQVSLLNANKATINGGTFNTPTGNDKTNIFVKDYGTSTNKGILVINGGTFNAESTLEGNVVTPVEINGGTFNYTVSFINNSEERQNKNDNLVNTNSVEVVGGTFADDSVTPKTGYTKYSIGNNEYVVASTITFDTTKENITMAVGEEKTIEVADLIKQYGKFTSSDESVATVNGNVIKALKEGKSTITIEFNGQTKTINLEVVVSPKTGDNILMYIIIGIISIFGFGLCVNNLKKKLFN